MKLKDFEKLVEDAQKKIDEVVKYVTDLSKNGYLDYTNLKLYDAFYYLWKDAETDFPVLFNMGYNFDAAFYNMCDNMYSNFEMMLEEYDLDFESNISRIGRTSSFYTHKYGTNNLNDVLNNVLNDLFFINCDEIEYDNDYKLVLYADSAFLNEYTKNEVIAELKYIINDMMSDCIDIFKDGIALKDIINNFKNNQVEYFKEYLKDEQDFLLTGNDN